MRIVFKNLRGDLSEESRRAVEAKLAPLERLLGEAAGRALLEIEVERAPAEGRSSEPYRLVANLDVDARVYHAEAVKPSPESAADRVRATIERELRHALGKKRGFVKRGATRVKDLFRFGR